MNELTPIFLPKETVSDEKYHLVEIFIESGQRVRKKDVLFAFESSKAAFEIESPTDGFVFFRLKEGDKVAFGELIAVVSPEDNFPEEYFSQYSHKKSEKENDSFGKKEHGRKGPTFSKSAIALINEFKIDKDIFFQHGIVKKSDVQKYLSSQQDQNIVVESALAAISINTQNIIIVGGGGHAKICIDILNEMKSYKIVGIVDPNLMIGSTVLNVPVIGRDENLKEIYNNGVAFAVNAVGTITRHPLREEIFLKLKKIGFQLPNLIHPKSSIASSASLGEGNQVMANATIGSSVTVANNCIINAGSILSHDSQLQDNVHIAPGAILAGGVSVGENTLVGMGVNVYLNVSIGSNVVINNGINVNKDIPNGRVLKS